MGNSPHDPEPSQNPRLDSWKEIAAYLKRSERTLRRWERSEGLPVHRHEHQKRASVYAYPSELDAWWRSRGAALQQAESRPGSPAGSRRLLATAAVIGAIVMAGLLFWRPGSRGPGPEKPYHVVPLTALAGIERYPSFSPDGKQVAFCWNGEKADNYDIYIQWIGAPAPVRLTSDPAADWSPSWSPDGRWIAFFRWAFGARAAILIRPVLPGPERKITEFSPLMEPGRGPSHGAYLTWTPDSKSLVFSDKLSQGPAGLFLVSVETGERRELTAAAKDNVLGDTAPAFSADGRSLAFIRIHYPGSELFWAPLSADIRPLGEPRQLTFDDGFATSPVWTPDGRQILFSAGQLAFAGRDIWSMAAAGPAGRAGPPQRLPITSEDTTAFTISRDGRRLALVRELRDPNIWRLDTVTGSRHVFASIASTRLEQGPQYSPDGRRIAFESERTGSREIWVAASDGSDPVQLTSLGRGMASTPRWSPDGQHIVFHSRLRGQGDIHIIGSEGGAVRRLTDEPSDESIPSWSRDGKWIYFCSTRGGTAQVWKSPVALASHAVQVTSSGGITALESVDGRDLYYTRGSLGTANSLWRMPVAGGPEAKVLDSLAHWNAFAVSAQGIYFIPRRDPADGSTIDFLSFETGRTRTLARIDKPVFIGLTASPDGRFVLYAQIDREESDLLLAELPDGRRKSRFWLTQSWR